MASIAFSGSSLSGKARSLLNQVWEKAVLGKTDMDSLPGTVGLSQGVVDGAPRSDIHDVAKSLHGIHNILKYDQYDPSNGLFYNDNSVSFCFEVMPQTGADEGMTEKLTQLFTPIPPGCGVQWALFGSPTVDTQMQDYLDLRHEAIDNGRAPDFFLEMASRRVAYIKAAKGRPLFPATNYVVKQLRLVFSVTRTGSSSDTGLCEELSELRELVQAQLKTSHLPAMPMDADALIRFVQPILDPALMFEGEPAPDLAYDDGKPIKDQVTPLGHHVRVAHDELLFGPPPSHPGAPDKRIAMRAFGVVKYPQKKELWEMANIIGSFFDDGLQYPCPFLVCGGTFTLDPASVDMKADLKGLRTKQNAKSKMAEFQPELEIQAQDWSIVAHQRRAGGTLAEIYHSLLLFAPRKVMSRASQMALNIWRHGRFTIGRMDGLHLPMLYASLPMTFTEKMRDDLRKFRVLTTKTTVNAVDMSPVIAEWQGAGQPVMMFFGRRGSPAFFDFYANQQGNYNFFLAGVSGSGKSVLCNDIVNSYRSIGARVWTIDVGRAYRNLISLQKGTFIEYQSRKPICSNPFSWVGRDPELTFKDELRILRPMVAAMASPSKPLEEFDLSLIGEAINGVWLDYGNDTNPTLISKYLAEKVLDQNGRVERRAYELAKQLGPFTEDGLYGPFFNGPATIDLDGDMIGIELEELKNAADLRRVVLFVLTSRIAADMYQSRSRKKLCLIDEAWQLLGSDMETARFIEEGYRRARKYEGIFGIATQSIEDAFKNEASKAAYNNADFKLLLRQDLKTLDSMINAGTVSFSPAVTRMLKSLVTDGGRYSEMLVMSPNGDAVVRNILDPFSLLMASSKGSDFTEIEGLLAQGYSTLETLTTMLKRRGIDA